MRDAISPGKQTLPNDALASYVDRDPRLATGGIGVRRGATGVKRTVVRAQPGRPSSAVDDAGGSIGRDGPIPALSCARLPPPRRERLQAGPRLAALRKAATVNNVMARFWRVRILEVDALGRARAGDIDAARRRSAIATALEEHVSARRPAPIVGETATRSGG